jgi:FAD/FMN-containing dehydrogenase/Fe-S oxidoreductase
MSARLIQGGTATHVSLDARVEAADLARELRAHALGNVLFDKASRGRYATDASIYQIEPVGVFVPAREEDALTALQIAASRKVPVLARGGGTSQCGQTVGAALVIDCSKHLRNVTALELERGEVEVQPGITLDELNGTLKPHGVWYPVDVSTSAQATLGGMAGNNSCGSRSIAYGNMVHNVAGVEAWLADGSAASFGPLAQSAGRAHHLGVAVQAIAAREADEIDRLWPTVMRRVGGYNLDVFRPRSERPYTADGSINLAHLLVGSEGTLAFTCRLRLKLSPLPAQRVLGVVNFPTFYAAMDAAQHIVTLGPTAVELVDRTMIELARANPAFRPTIEGALIGEPNAILLVEFTSDDKAALIAQLKRLSDLMGTLGLPNSVVEMTADKPQKELWEVRKAGLNIMMSLRGDGKPVSFIEDCAVPLQHLAEYTAKLTEVFARHGTRGTWYAHASVGTLHVRPILDMRRDGEQKMRAIAEEASALVRQYKGAYSGEHGDGLVRSEWIAWQFGPRLTAAFEEIKRLFDPAGLLNPGKIVRPPKMDDRALFRYAPGYAVLPLETALDWSPWNVHNDPATEALTSPGTGGDPARGFGKAVEMCNNNGHCRKFDAGTMCPSFRVTRDEAHLTRGRANTLRLALSGQLGQEALASDSVKQALDLCVSCKGCKRECPTGVDMARMKIEVQHHYKARHGYTLRDRLIAHLPRYAGMASRVAGLVNLRNRLPWLARLGESFTGFSAQRSLPEFRSDVFTRDLLNANTPAPAPCTGSKQVVLFADTFNNHFEPDILRDAQRVLAAAGYEVAVVQGADRPLCCGRTYLGTGMVEQAKAEARRTLDALLPWARARIAIVGLEPSCLFSFRDEYLALGLGKEAEELSRAALLFEEFVVREHAAGRFAAPFEPLAGMQALLHTHCHQKAFGAVPAVQQALGLVPGLSVQHVESSCCGMAGSFGMEVEHVEVSRAMGELALLPAVRAADANTLIVADGTSCRHQIHEGARRSALHVVQVMARALV